MNPALISEKRESLVFIPLHGISANEPAIEDASEFERIEVLFSTETSGIIEAYKCNSCPAKVFHFDGYLVVENAEGSILFQQLKYVDGKEGVVTWRPDTTRAARILMY